VGPLFLHDTLDGGRDVTDTDLLLLRHISGTASAEDEARLRHWIEDDPRNRERLDLLRKAWDAASGPGGIDHISPDVHPAGRTTRPTAAPEWYSSPFARIAAVLAVVVGTAAVLATPHHPFLAAPTQAYATGAGERTALRLGDGSRIVLGPESRVRLPARFPPDLRAVQLEGAAYFEVAPDPGRPFEVRAGGTLTRVLGTRFVVRAYAGDPGVEVGVAEGRVSVRSAASPEAEPLELRENQVARVDSVGNARVLQETGLAPLLGWLSGRLVFRDRPLHEIARELERWYGIEIRIDDPGLAARRLTLSFKDASLKEVLEVIAAALRADLVIQSNSAALHPSSAGV
jgi:transmembrane sensor